MHKFNDNLNGTPAEYQMASNSFLLVDKEHTGGGARM
jgi:hypothetical protein